MLKLAIENTHARDSRIDFNEAAHEYSIDGKVVVGSVSSLWASRFEKFDARRTASACYPKWAKKTREGWELDVWNYTKKYVQLIEGGEFQNPELLQNETDKGYGNLLRYFWGKSWKAEKCVEEIVGLWSKLGEKASERGTFVHRQAELHCNEEPFENGSEKDIEIIQYMRFRKDNPSLTPFRTEWSVYAYLDAFVVAGQIDCVYVDEKGEYHMIDYKCCAHELSDDNAFSKFGSFPFDGVADTSFGHYACQQNIYRFILENFYGFRLSSCKLLRVHSTISNYELVNVPNLQHRVSLLFEDLRLNTVRRNLKLTRKQQNRKSLRNIFTAVKFIFYCRKSLSKTKMKKSINEYEGSDSEEEDTRQTQKRKYVVSSEDEEDTEPGDAIEEEEPDKNAAPYGWWRDEFGLLANKIMDAGGFPVKAGNFWLHNGISIMNEGALTVTSKLGGPVESSSLIKETNSFYLQPQHDDQRVYAVLFGTCKERYDNTRFNDFKSTFKMRLDNVSQLDITKFQGLPKWSYEKNTDTFSEVSKEQIYESVRESTAYKMLKQCFCMELAAQVSKVKLSKEHMAKGSDEEGKFIDKYIRERLGKIDQDEPYNLENTDFTWLKDKTKLSLPLIKDENNGGEWKTFTDSAETAEDERRSPSFEVELPIKPVDGAGDGRFELKPPGRGPKVTKVNADGTKSRATAADIIKDFPLKDMGGGPSTAQTKMVMVFVQYDTLQNAKFAGPGLRCNVKELAYIMAKPQESVNDACERFNS
jgi:hypothetical protein